MSAAGVVAEPSFVVETDAILLTFPQVVAVVGEVNVTDSLPPPAISPRLQVSTPPETEQDAGYDQLSPAFVGSVSVIVTFRAMPRPGLETVIV